MNIHILFIECVWRPWLIKDYSLFLARSDYVLRNEIPFWYEITMILSLLLCIKHVYEIPFWYEITIPTVLDKIKWPRNARFCAVSTAPRASFMLTILHGLRGFARLSIFRQHHSLVWWLPLRGSAAAQSVNWRVYNPIRSPLSSTCHACWLHKHTTKVFNNVHAAIYFYKCCRVKSQSIPLLISENICVTNLALRFPYLSGSCRQ